MNENNIGVFWFFQLVSPAKPYLLFLCNYIIFSIAFRCSVIAGLHAKETKSEVADSVT